MRGVHTQTGNRLKELREARGLKLRELVPVCERDQSMVWRYEDGTTPIPQDVLRRLCTFYGVTAEHLLGWDREVAA
jgi:transcriptional regulator with XRE-family HTH domain